MKRENLLIVAGLVWAIAGANVLAIGVRCFVEFSNSGIPRLAVLGLGAVIIFAAFFRMFSRMVQKNTARILALPGERQNPFKFMNAHGYVIMAIMMSGGFGLRFFGLVPSWFVAFFYSGLGLALTVAGALFLAKRFES